MLEPPESAGIYIEQLGGYVRRASVWLGCFVLAVLAAGELRGQSATTPPSLSAEITRRIETEIRSRYSVPAHIDIVIYPPEASAVPGYDHITVIFNQDEKKTSFDFLVSKDRKTLARLEKIDISEDMMSQIDVKGRPVRGNPNAKVTIINFDDLECPFCARMHSTLFPGLLKAYGDRVKVIYKDYPLVEIHPWAMHAAIDANCLAEQNSKAYWDLSDYVHSNAKVVGGNSPAEAFANLDKQTMTVGESRHLNAQKLKDCVTKSDDSAVRASLAEGDKLGVDATPTLFINGEKLSGALPEEDVRAIIDRQLTLAGENTPTVSARK
jgi:protein-disulfide isomerase